MAESSPRVCETLRRLPSMGTFFEVQLVSNCDKPIETSLFLEIQQELDKMESEMSLYQSESPISRLNRDGVLLSPIPEHLRKVTQLSIEAYRQTQHRFDMSIWPVLQLIQDSFKTKGTPPSEQDLKNLNTLIGSENVELNEVHLLLKKKGMGITLDGIAKGYAVDWVSDILAKKGYGNFLVNFSGNMKWMGRGVDAKGERRAWEIRRWDPIKKQAVKIKTLSSGAVASSGGEVNFYDKKKQWHHIIDPKTLQPARKWIQTTAIGPRAVDTDVLSTATFVMSAGEIEEILREHYPEFKIYGLDAKGKLRIFGIK